MNSLSKVKTFNRPIIWTFFNISFFIKAKFKFELPEPFTLKPLNTHLNNTKNKKGEGISESRTFPMHSKEKRCRCPLRSRSTLMELDGVSRGL